MVALKGAGRSCNLQAACPAYRNDLFVILF